MANAKQFLISGRDSVRKQLVAFTTQDVEKHRHTSSVAIITIIGLLIMLLYIFISLLFSHSNMPVFRVTYFNGRGRAEVMRQILAYAGQAYEDRRIKDDEIEWPKLKPGKVII